MTEQAYEAQNGPARAAHLRRTILIGLLFYNSYNLTSIYLMPDILWQAVFMRLGVVTLASVGLAFFVIRVSGAVREKLITLGMMNAFALPVFLFWFSHAPLATYSFGETTLSLVFANMLLTLRFKNAVVFTSFAFCVGVVAVLLHPALPHGLAAAFILQITTACAFTLLGNYLIERQRCDAFIKVRAANAVAENATTQSLHLERMSLTDALTGLPNRRALDLTLDDVGSRSETFAVMMIDIDHFKLFNDTLGHQHGDECLRRIGVGFQFIAEKHDIYCARYGGEEFMLLATGAPVQQLMHLAQEIVQNVYDMGIIHPSRVDGLDRVTISVGVADRHAAGNETIAQIVNAADDALYQAKRNGRNRFELYGDLGTQAVHA